MNGKLVLLEKLNSLYLADELSLDDFDLQKIIIDKDKDGYCLLKMSKEISQVYFSTARLLIKYENFRKKLLSKFCDVNDSMLNKDNTSVYTELTNYPSNYNQSGLIVQTHTSEISKISEQISDVSVNKENKLLKLKWPGYFVFPKEKLSDNLIKKLEDTQITIDEKDKREITTQIFNRLLSIKNPICLMIYTIR
ncbi:hypothetical protein BpHYR1_050488 [Brachionus plicatilis]|uniref:Uncharacterized protein n=1 Tax=Brachionus plicatilis TaxID=10195 RepID=A0A3M7T2D6_BRAPC|nr:hypothetical protein BpHYR1_050488 [Brachionus plicatilis]